MDIKDLDIKSMDIERLFKELFALEWTEAVALGGSRAAGKSDESSDIDVYVYVTGEIPLLTRREILGKYCSEMEIGNHYWEAEDNCVLNNGIDIDIIYRDLDDFSKEIEYVVDGGNAHNGYTTCMWHNLLTCRILYDKNGRLTELKSRFRVPYPRELKINIIENNMHLLSGRLPSYDMQIKKAYLRGDHNSINHRVTEFLASYFDIIFAVNEMTHPGEKRLVQICREQCRILPEHFEENMEKLFGGMFGEEVCGTLAEMTEEMKKMIASCPDISDNWK